uniref:Inositol polyphosphate-related phosphatase domain-containing protein n=1 Tax=Ditylenchus dipsaci TaxID=166011 RepID=A0A915DDL5_9BILA
MPLTCSDICKILFALLFPPLGVFLEVGCSVDLLINIGLTLLGFIPAALTSTTFTNDFPVNICLLDHANVFWKGNLNYRLDTDMSSQQLMTRCNCNQHYSLLQFDELQNELNSKSAFSGFQEANENFKPTYKYYIGSFEWDTR